ncbi:MAG: hypothetical protein NTZ05_03510 [Chloroflexi bacterium]|nr:hypothetical protein [Chloroflexota bacterium]
MPNSEIMRLLGELIAVQRQCTEVAASFTNAQLDTMINVRGTDQPVRGQLYNMVLHPREHYVHLQKVLQETGAPGAAPTEAQLIMDQAAQSLGAVIGLFARMTDDDLDREHEGHSPRNVLEHLAAAHGAYLQRMRQAAGQVGE